MTPLAATPRSATEGLLGWMEAMGDPIRLRVLRALERHELSVVELCEVLALPQSTVSRHLKVLADGGLVASRRHGTQSLFAWKGEVLPGARKLWAVARAESEDWPKAREDAARLSSVLALRGGGRRFFAGRAGAWDELRTSVYGKVVNLRALLLLLPQEWTVADLGCGTGELAAALAVHARRVIGVDQSSGMLRVARTRTEGLPNVELHEADLASLPVDSGRCDAAILSLVLGYLPDPAPALHEAARILRPGGRLAILDAAWYLDEDLRRSLGQSRAGFEPKELERLVVDSGLDVAFVRALPPEPGAKGPGLVVCAAEKPFGKKKAKQDR